MAGFSEGMQAGHLIAQDSIDLFNTGYSVYQDQRNYDFSKDVFDYNKALQQEIFSREDTAYERKRRDLERAGLNPNLAAGGSGSAAGAIVGNSNQAGDHQIYKADLMRNYGQFLSAMQAQEQLKQQKLQTDFLKNEQTIELSDQKNNQVIQEITRLYDSGVDVSDMVLTTYRSQKTGRYEMHLMTRDKFTQLIRRYEAAGGTWDYERNFGIDSDNNACMATMLINSKYWKALENGWQLDLNDLAQSNIDTNMMGVEEDYQTGDKWFNYIMKALNLVFGNGGMAGALNGARRNNARGHRR